MGDFFEEKSSSKKGVPRVLQAYPGEFLKEKFEFKDEEFLEFSKLTQVSS